MSWEVAAPGHEPGIIPLLERLAEVLERLDARLDALEAADEAEPEVVNVNEYGAGQCSSCGAILLPDMVEIHRCQTTI